MRRAVMGDTEDDNGGPEDEETVVAGAISQERYAEMSASEDLLLLVTSRGMGKVTSAHDYPVRGRGGQGVRAMDLSERRGERSAPSSLPSRWSCRTR
jgi:DNA gyrase subunit A